MNKIRAELYLGECLTLLRTEQARHSCDIKHSGTDRPTYTSPAPVGMNQEVTEITLIPPRVRHQKSESNHEFPVYRSVVNQA